MRVAQLFISHSSKDSALAVTVHERLADLGYESVFLDVSAEGGLVAGTAWRDQLFTNLDRCQALVLIGTPASNASLWCHSELALARWLRKPILALLVDSAEPHELVADIQGVRVASADVNADVLRKGLVALGMEQESAWDPDRSPFPGLQPLDESYAPVFFGRERQVEELRQLVDPPSRLRQGTLLPVLGPSGSGKSSLVRAGLVAGLRNAPDWVVSDPWTPSDVPLADLALALSHAAKRFDLAVESDECRDLLDTPGGMNEFVRRLRAGGELSDKARVLVVIDQAEELVTVTSEGERTALFKALATSVTQPSPLRVVMTARTDLWDLVSATATRVGLEVAPAVLHVPPLSRSDLARVISEPARRADLSLEEGLLERLVEDTGRGDALPLLAYTLSRMTSLAAERTLTHAGYDAIGGVRGAIASRASDVARGARTQGEVAAAVLQLVGTGDGHPAARLARVDSVPAPQRAILDDLVEARLVVVREQGDHPVYAPAHEALFTAWPPLAEMLTLRQDDLRQRSRLERGAADWREAGSAATGILSGAGLESAETWQERSPDLVSADVAEYVAHSAGRQRRTRLVRLGVGIGVAGLAAALVVVLLVNAKNDRRQAADARARTGAALATVVELNRTRDPVAAAVAAITGLGFVPESPELQDAAAELLSSPARDVMTVGGQSAGATAAAGTDLVLAATDAGSAVVFDIRSGGLVRALPDASGLPLAVRSDDRVAVLNGTDGLALWELAGESDEPLTRLPRSGAIAAFSPDGALLVSVSGTLVTLWSVADPSSPGEIDSWNADSTRITASAVTDDGKVLTSGADSVLTTWTPLTGMGPTKVVTTPPPTGVTVNRLVPSADGSRVLVANTAVGRVTTYDLDTGTAITDYVPAERGTDEPFAAAQAAFTATMDPESGQVVVFDLQGRGYAFARDESTKAVAVLDGHTGTVGQATVTADGLLVTGSVDKSIRVWDTRAPSRAESDGDESAVDALCAAFGGRFDEASIAVALGNEDFSNPCPKPDDARTVAPLALSSAVPHGSDVDTIEARDDFDDAYTLFLDGTTSFDDGSRTTHRIVAGEQQMTSSGKGPRDDIWNTVNLTRALGSSTTSAKVRSPQGSTCGLAVGDRTYLVNVMLDPASGRGAITTYKGNTGLLSWAFRAGPGRGRAPVRALAAELTDGEVVVSVDGEEVDRVEVPVTANSTAGFAVEGSDANCFFDDFVVAETDASS